jgi:hypothetical protein
MSVAISCQACGAILQIPDALYERRFAGRQVKLRCKKCPAVISVDDTEATPPTNAATTSSTPKPLGELSELMERMPQRSMSPTSLGAVTIGVEQLELPDEEEAPLPESLPSITAAPEAIDLTPSPVPNSAPPSAPPAAPRKRWQVMLAASAALAAALALHLRGNLHAETPATAPRAAPVAAASPAPELESPPPAPEPAIAPLPEVPSAPLPEPPAPEPNYNEAALNRTLRSGVKRAEGCHRGGRATGTVQVAIRFATSGRVTSATIDDPLFANAPVGRCIVAYMKAMIIPPFTGPELEISKEITLTP